MANRFYKKYKEAVMKALAADITGANNLFVQLIDMGNYGLAITAATNANPSQVTAASHGLSVGDPIIITGVLGATGLNGYQTVNTVVDANNFTVSLGSAPGAYTSGGKIVKIGADDFLDDVPSAARIGPATNAASVTCVNGVLKFTSPLNIPGVTGADFEAFIFYLAGANDAARRLVYFGDTATSGLPGTPNGSGWDFTIPASGLAEI